MIHEQIPIIMLRAKLFTADGGYVSIVDVPPFVTGFPKVLIWGERIFTLSSELQPDGLGIYTETFAYAVPPPLEVRPTRQEGSHD